VQGAGCRVIVKRNEKLEERSDEPERSGARRSQIPQSGRATSNKEKKLRSRNWKNIKN